MKVDTSNLSSTDAIFEAVNSRVPSMGGRVTRFLIVNHCWVTMFGPPRPDSVLSVVCVDGMFTCKNYCLSWCQARTESLMPGGKKIEDLSKNGNTICHKEIGLDSYPCTAC